MGVPGTGKSLNFTGLVIHRIVEGKIQDAWLEFDMFGVMRQMGAIPTPA
jgi:predicted ester cyclase